ncbi:hypothetical protein CARUB_v10000523mg [Capsella rubella]|uniref:Myb-like domain-containing protein n=1 Tax=Capsella rubella TaxID=81985 RepID=R0H618_9BRAS|nr:trihelix transcription factor GTL2 [Capsella rubella]EOA20220.1 hypothetical protein CARUB_v10000523mg [Capsella rubella]
MFDGGVPEQIHRFITSPPPASPLPPHQPAAERSLPFPASFASFNTYHHQAQHILSLDSRKIIHHHHHHHHHDIKDSGVATTAEWIGHTDHDGSDNHHHPWCSDEVLALLRFRSTVENWFPEFTWEHTSRKLAEVGFKRSPQECKEKFEEEERRYFNGNNNNNTSDHHQHIGNYNNKGNSYRIFSEVEEFYDGHVSPEVGDNQNKRTNSLERKGNVEETGQDLMDEDKLRDQDQGQVEEASMGNKMNLIDVGKVVEDDVKSSSSSSLMMVMREKKKKKRKRKKEKERFGVLKGFCEGLVRNMIAQQEEMHKKLLEDMAKKEEEKIAREEDWKKQEMERVNKELEVRKQEQAMASDRNTNIIKFISKFTDHDLDQDLSSLALPQTQGRRKKFQTSSSSLLHQTLTPLTNDKSLQPIPTKTLKTKTQNPKPPKSEDKSDLGKRWPKDEVLALINIRRNISNNMNDDESSSPSSKAVPLWERISKKMLELGYKRSAKRCKEKWENINKYFRKTKDVNKKRPLDSRTCPYFHQLTALYSQPSTGTTATTTATATSAGDLETRPEETRVGSEDLDNIPTPMHVDADGTGDKSNVQFSGFDLEF